MSELCVAAVAFRANRVDVALEQMRLARLVRLMAARATAAVRLDGMDRYRVLHLVFDVLVASEADCALVVVLDEARFVGGVRIVAGDAARLERLVRARLLCQRLDGRVAAIAELRRRFCP